MILSFFTGRAVIVCENNIKSSFQRRNGTKMKKRQRQDFQDTKRFDGEEQYNRRLLNKAVKPKTYARKRKFQRKEIK